VLARVVATGIFWDGRTIAEVKVLIDQRFPQAITNKREREQLYGLHRGTLGWRRLRLNADQEKLAGRGRGASDEPLCPREACDGV